MLCKYIRLNGYRVGIVGRLAGKEEGELVRIEERAQNTGKIEIVKKKASKTNKNEGANSKRMKSKDGLNKSSQ